MVTTKQIILAALKQKFPRISASITQIFQGVTNCRQDVHLLYTVNNNKNIEPMPTQTNYQNHLQCVHANTIYTEKWRDLKQCLPFFALFMIPGIGLWLSLPLAMYAPNKFLSRQFWTEEQRCKIYNTKLTKRQKLFPGAIEYLQKELDKINDPGIKRQCHNLISSSDRGLNKEELKLFRRAIGQFPRLDESKYILTASPLKPILRTSCIPYSDHNRSKLLIKSLRQVDQVLFTVLKVKTDCLPELDNRVLDLLCWQRAIRVDTDKTEQLIQFEAFLKQKPTEYQRYTIFDLYVPILMFGHEHWFSPRKGN